MHADLRAKFAVVLRLKTSRRLQSTGFFFHQRLDLNLLRRFSHYSFGMVLDAHLLVHGDDFISLGHGTAHGEVARVLSSRFTIKLRSNISSCRHDGRECEFGLAPFAAPMVTKVESRMNRIPRHAEAIIKPSKLEQAKVVPTPPERQRWVDVFIGHAPEAGPDANPFHRRPRTCRKIILSCRSRRKNWRDR